MDDDKEWTVFLYFYASAIGVYGCFVFAFLLVRTSMQVMQKRFATENDTPDRVTIEKKIAAAELGKSSSALSNGSVSSIQSYLPMSSVSSLAHLDVRELLEEHQVESVVVRDTSTEEVILSYEF